jgi:hypothetical protein
MQIQIQNNFFLWIFVGQAGAAVIKLLAGMVAESTTADPEI